MDRLIQKEPVTTLPYLIMGNSSSVEYMGEVADYTTVAAHVFQYHVDILEYSE